MTNESSAKPGEIDIDEWVVVTTAGGRCYLGKLDKTPPVGEAEKAITNHLGLRLYPAFDYVVQSRGQQTSSGTVIQREPLIMPVDLVVLGVPVYATPSSIYFCIEMEEGDKKVHRELIKKGTENSARSRAARSGITV